jgi:hypothetical protein
MTEKEATKIANRLFRQLDKCQVEGKRPDEKLLAQYNHFMANVPKSEPLPRGKGKFFRNM